MTCSRHFRPLALAACFAAGAAAEAAAQDLPVEVGVKGGLVISNFSIDPPITDDPTWRTGLSGGIFVATRPAGRVGAQFEALITQRGSTVVDAADEAELRFRTTYLDASVFARGRMATLASGDLYAFGGVTIGLELESEFVEVDSGVFEEREDIGDLIEDTEVSLAGGVGLFVGRFLVEARYTAGLTDTGLSSPTSTVHHRSLSILAGVRF
jgi:hypothetical protein